MFSLRQIASWILALFLVVMYVHATFHPLPSPPVGSVKFFDLPGENIVFSLLAKNSGYDLFEPTGRVATGFVEILAAILLFFPASRKLGAFLSCMILMGAIVLHLSQWLGRDIPLSLEPGETATDGGVLFALAIGMLVISILVLTVHPSQRKRRR